MRFRKLFKSRFMAYLPKMIGSGRIKTADGTVYTDNGTGWRRETPGYSCCREWKRERLRRKLDKRRDRRAAKRSRLQTAA